MPTDRMQRRAEALPLQQQIGERVLHSARSLSPEQWEGATNCPPWIVKTIVAHLVRNAEMFNVMLDTGLAGGQTFPQTPAQREERQMELSAMSTKVLTETFETSHSNLRERLASLTSSELEQPCPHPRWLIPAWWIIDQRVVELAFHTWDMETSIGQDAEIDDRAAQFILPAIIENNLPLFHRPDPSHTGSWAIQATDIADGRWHIESSEHGALVSRAVTSANVEIAGDSAVLVRWLYGRADLDDLVKSGKASIQGDAARAISWREAFPSP